MSDLAERLRDLAPRIDHEMARKRFERIRARRRRRRQVTLAAAVVVGVLLAALGVVALAGDPSDESSVIARPEGYEGLWERLPELPPVREDLGAPGAVWSGRELIIWGGGEEHAVVYSPDAGVRELAEAPIPSRRDPVAVQARDQVLFWGGFDERGRRTDGALYDPEADSWTEVSPSPLAGGVPLAAVWTGREVIIVGDTDRSAATDRLVAGAAYDPASDAWRELPDAPVAINFGNGVWTGSELVIVGSRLDGANQAIQDTAAIAFYPGAAAWRVLPSPGLSPQSMWVENSATTLMAWDYELTASTMSVFGTDGGWRSLGAVPLEFSECYVNGANRGGGFYLLNYCGHGAVLLMPTGRWVPIATPPATMPPVETSFGIVILNDRGGWVLRESSVTGRSLTSAPPDPGAAVTPADEELVAAFLRLANAPGFETAAAVPFADEVHLGLGPELRLIRTREELGDPEAWRIEVEDHFRGWVGPFSALELAGDAVGVTVSEGEHSHCASPPVPPPPTLVDLRRVSFQPDPVPDDTCIYWWTVDLFVNDDGEVEAVTLDRWEP